MNRFEAIETSIRSSSSDRQLVLAVELASLVEPFADVSRDGQPEQGLSAIARSIRAAANLAEVDRARSILWSTPELADDDEPVGSAWFSLGATVAWLYGLFRIEGVAVRAC